MLKIKEIINNVPVIITDTPVDSVEISESDKSTTQEKFIKDNNYRLFVRETNIKDIYKFGCQQLIKTLDHNVGYMWASRASIINGQFDTEISDVIIENQAGRYGLSINTLKDLLEEYYNTKVEINQVEVGANDSREVIYTFHKVTAVS